MKKSQKITGLLLALCMLVSIVAVGIVPATAADYTTYAQETVQGSNMLHCFNWSYNNIKAKLPEIAAAGYTAVQTSPVTSPKDYNASYTDIGNQWWKLYQPLGFTISNGNTWLGTKAQLTSLCAEAEKYDIKVIVDIVANHLANNGNDGGTYAYLNSGVEADMKNSAYYHTNNSFVNENSRYNITQYHIKMPDLNTANSHVQERVLGLLEECLDCGVDGFRFDAAKHIEVPNDPANCRSDFWPTVINGAKEYAETNNLEEPFIYGEILGSPGPNCPISNYTEYMAVTDNVSGDRALGKAYGSSASGLANATYSKGAAAAESVLWVESHDTYMGDSGSYSGLNNTSGVSSSVINKAWAIVGARADSTALFFARPNSVMGQASTDTNWKSATVTEINKFKNHFNGTSEKLSYSGNTAYIERGNGGVVISKLDGAGDVSLTAYKMADGSYTDQLTGNTFTVSGGVISGTVGSTGVAVVYDHAAAPVEPTDPPANSIAVQFTDALNWGGANVHYWGGSESSSWPGAEMTQVSTDANGYKVYQAYIPSGTTGIVFNYNGKQTVNIESGISNGAKWYAINEKTGDNYKVSTGTPPVPTSAPTQAPTSAPAGTITVKFTDALNWGGANIHYWGGSSTTSWPGNAMTQVSTDGNGYKVYQASIPSNTTGIVFNYGGSQTVNIESGIVNGAQWYTVSQTSGSNYMVNAGAPTQPTTAPSDTITVKFTDNKNWGGANIHYWGSSATTWPGVAMTYSETNSYGEKVYQAAIPSGTTGVVFNYGSSQTVDITTGIVDGAQWYPIEAQTDGKYTVGYVTPSQPTEAPTSAVVGSTSYYVVGNMNDWTINASYKLTKNTLATGEEYYLNGLHLTSASQFKVVSYTDGVQGGNPVWYPDGSGNNYGENGEITAAGTYNIYFRPNEDGGDDWFNNVIYAAFVSADPTQAPTQAPTEAPTEEPTKEPSTEAPVITQPVILVQPADWSGAEGEDVDVFVVAQGDELSYRWYYWKADKNKWIASDDKDANYDSIKMAQRFDGRRVRCKITDKYGNTLTSDEATLTCSSGPVITSQPADWTGRDGEQIHISVAASGADLSYQWYYYKESKNKWVAATDTDADYDELTMASKFNGRRVYCKITDKNGVSVNSEEATISYPAGPVIITQPADWTGAQGSMVSIKVVAQGEDLTYQWFYRPAGKSNWIATDDVDDTYNIKLTNARNGREVRCKITDKYGNTVTSDSAVMTIG